MNFALGLWLGLGLGVFFGMLLFALFGILQRGETRDLDRPLVTRKFSRGTKDAEADQVATSLDRTHEPDRERANNHH